tara:strand:+ start:642 stop:752 length:111 start_codon:yes stop_codon:yes gene_type:complete
MSRIDIEDKNSFVEEVPKKEIFLLLMFLFLIVIFDS